MMDEWSCHKSVKGEVNGSMQLANKGLPILYSLDEKVCFVYQILTWLCAPLCCNIIRRINIVVC